MRRLLSFLLCASCAAAATAQRPTVYGDDERKSAAAVAGEALQTFGRLVNERNYAELGFVSPDEPRSATLGEPIQEFMIRLDRLREYGSGQDTAGILTATDRLTYPVLVGEETRSSLTVGGGERGWAALSFGAPKYSRLLTEVRDRLSREEKRPAADYFEVRVPALNVSFVARQAGQSLALTPILDDPRFGFVRGQTLPAERALAAMQQAAREHNGLPT
ncbi:MAG TPA: hypothetical protein VF121_04035 [Thermoanaerobaculia bacterium]|nr:hypothetical protein [Thermoanaerobaculia bacterium]